MKRLEIRVVGGVLLILFGVLALLQSLGILEGALTLLWGLLFGAGGVLFLYTFLSDRTNWWAIIPGFVMLSIGVLLGLEFVAPDLGGNWGGPLVVGGISLAFWIIYFTRRDQWWAVIPAGVMLTITLVIALSNLWEGFDAGGIFLLGLGATFGLLALLPTPDGRMTWASIPAAVLSVVGLIVTASIEIVHYIWPISLILAGLHLVYRVLKPRP
ncbi:MAG TPA: hypothetical protein ENN99_12275 [Chloroflexi bacterium]|nr:hypothetical protein [Chloroflexota bacterium]